MVGHFAVSGHPRLTFGLFWLVAIQLVAAHIYPRLRRPSSLLSAALVGRSGRWSVHCHQIVETMDTVTFYCGRWRCIDRVRPDAVAQMSFSELSVKRCLVFKSTMIEADCMLYRLWKQYPHQKSIDWPTGFFEASHIVWMCYLWTTVGGYMAELEGCGKICHQSSQNLLLLDGKTGVLVPEYNDAPLAHDRRKVGWWFSGAPVHRIVANGWPPERLFDAPREMASPSGERRCVRESRINLICGLCRNSFGGR